MDINDIKRPGTYEPSFEAPAETSPGPKGQGSFAATAAKVLESSSTKSLGVVTQFDKSALADPQKLDTMVRACVSELVDSGQSVTGTLSSSDKQSLLNFLSADPWLRQEVEKYLRKVLT